jgi:hypothetical protein
VETDFFARTLGIFRKIILEINFWPLIKRLRVRSPALPQIYMLIRSGTGSTQPRERNLVDAPPDNIASNKRYSSLTFHSNSVSQTKLRVGTSYVEEEGSLYQAVSMFIHEDYNDNTMDNDIAIIKVCHSCWYQFSLQYDLFSFWYFRLFQLFINVISYNRCCYIKKCRWMREFCFRSKHTKTHKCDKS